VLETVEEPANGAVDDVIEVAAAVAEPVDEAAAPVTETVDDLADGALDDAVDAAATVTEPVDEAAAPVIERVDETVDTVTGAVDDVADVATPVTEPVGEVVASVVDQADVAVSPVTETVDEVVGVTPEAVTDPEEEVVVGVSSVPSGAPLVLEMRDAAPVTDASTGAVLRSDHDATPVASDLVGGLAVDPAPAHRPLASGSVPAVTSAWQVTGRASGLSLSGFLMTTGPLSAPPSAGDAGGTSFVAVAQGGLAGPSVASSRSVVPVGTTVTSFPVTYRGEPG
jgi:hypothetical protein